jgi:hypothetical protein
LYFPLIFVASLTLDNGIVWIGVISGGNFHLRSWVQPKTYNSIRLFFLTNIIVLELISIIYLFVGPPIITTWFTLKMFRSQHKDACLKLNPALHSDFSFTWIMVISRGKPSPLSYFYRATKLHSNSLVMSVRPTFDSDMAWIVFISGWQPSHRSVS